MSENIISDQLSVSFQVYADHVSLQSITYKDRIFFSGEAELFQLTLLCLDTKEKVKLSSSAQWTTCFVEDGTFIFTDKEKDIKVILNADSSKENTITWSASIVNNSESFAVFAMDYPRLTVNSSEASEVFFPVRSGTAEKGITKEKMYKREGIYPASAAIMQYMAVSESGYGLYYGIHDKFGAQKTFMVNKAENESKLSMWAEYVCRDATGAKNSQTLNGNLVWQAFDGDWYNAALIYKQFITKNASWIPSFDEKGRTGVPEWMRNGGIWWQDGVDGPNYTQRIIEASEDIGKDIPAIVHIYTWHKIPFDNDYPHYFPALPYFKKSISELQSHGIKVMPYINGRLWDTHDREDQDYQFTDEALPGATKNEHGQPNIESYESKEKNGEPVKLAVMCPASTVWGQKLEENLNRLFYEFNVDAVYADQIASAWPFPCCDKSHFHPTGGGGWWVEAYNRALERVTRTLPPEKAITTESTAEPYMRTIPGYLSWDSVDCDEVPAWSVVYAGYACSFGRCYHGTKTLYYALLAESYTFGEQPGWISPNLYLSLEHKDFYRAIVRDRYAHRSFFNNGTLLHPPVIECDLPDLVGETLHGAYHTSPVKACLWRRNTDGKTLLAVFNCCDQTAEIKLKSELFSDGEKTFVLNPYSFTTEEF